MRRAGHVARMQGKYLIGKRERRRPLGRPSCRSEDNIKLDLKEIEWEDLDWINLTQDMDL
jgi:hypothetical protein